ncbi:uncharacterized protein RCC_00547 [Ramularia collo-cygni]|uniref:Uncharacterized protein n=1 Tax=Ramularia collo-cygni TaxID=112498 RepID=A0A2D3ULD4_9PEZI|nr:uncharacterized protein RCC_00547 [Ramularia collo-cygni]CZT14572.1 uncharacterized protein RCC_00547 [Ramularia collo-cygni]
MKVSFFAIPAFIAGVFAGPIARDASSAEVNALVANLQQSVLAHDAHINSTIAQMNSGSTAEQNATAIASIQKDLDAISISFVQASQAVPSQKTSLSGRSDPTKPIENAIPKLEKTIDDLICTIKALLPFVGNGALGPTLDNLNALVDGLLFTLTPLLAGLLDPLLTGVGSLLQSLLT